LKGRKDALVARVWESLDKEEEVVEKDSRLLKYPELQKHGLADKLKTHVYTCSKARAFVGDDDAALLALDVSNAADHWAGNHSKCAEIDSSRRCVKEGRGKEQAYYVEGGETHLAVKL
jgi:hypothetical protein